MGDIITLQELFNGFSLFVRSLLGAFSNALKLFFTDLPTIGGLSLGWWLVGLAVIPIIIGAIIGGSSDD